MKLIKTLEDKETGNHPDYELYFSEIDCILRAFSKNNQRICGWNIPNFELIGEIAIDDFFSKSQEIKISNLSRSFQRFLLFEHEGRGELFEIRTFEQIKTINHLPGTIISSKIYDDQDLLAFRTVYQEIYGRSIDSQKFLFILRDEQALGGELITEYIYIHQKKEVIVFTSNKLMLIWDLVRETIKETKINSFYVEKTYSTHSNILNLCKCSDNSFKILNLNTLTFSTICAPMFEIKCFDFSCSHNIICYTNLHGDLIKIQKEK
jgi:hypothetical protein